MGEKRGDFFEAEERYEANETRAQDLTLGSNGKSDRMDATKGKDQ